MGKQICTNTMKNHLLIFCRVDCVWTLLQRDSISGYTSRETHRDAQKTFL